MGGPAEAYAWPRELHVEFELRRAAQRVAERNVVAVDEQQRGPGITF